jgi:prepilin-type N-terminal cleavage/methylation domain-containing protein
MTKPRTYGLAHQRFLGGFTRQRLWGGSVRRSLDEGGFTLIEMLTVLVIIGIMLGIGIPAVTNMMKSGALGAATRHVSNTLSQARQYAITQRVRTRVVFPYSGTTTIRTNQVPAYLSYSVMTNNPSTSSWGYLSKWEFLPVGVVFLRNGPGALDNLSPASVPFPNTTSGADQLGYIEFTPTGAALQNDTLVIHEGHMNGTTPNATGANAATATVDSIVGRIRVTR